MSTENFTRREVMEKRIPLWVEVSNGTGLWRKRIFSNDEGAESCRCVRKEDEQKYIDNELLFKLDYCTNYRPIKTPEDEFEEKFLGKKIRLGHWPSRDYFLFERWDDKESGTLGGNSFSEEDGYTKNDFWGFNDNWSIYEGPKKRLVTGLELLGNYMKDDRGDIYLVTTSDWDVEGFKEDGETWSESKHGPWKSLMVEA